MNETEKLKYYEIDHFHCWQSKNPPCGQKIKHFECCLCKKLNPEIENKFAQIKAENLKKIEGIKNPFFKETEPESYFAFNDALDEIKKILG